MKAFCNDLGNVLGPESISTSLSPIQQVGRRKGRLPNRDPGTAPLLPETVCSLRINPCGLTMLDHMKSNSNIRN